MLKASLFSVFDLNIQLRERPNQEIFFFYYTKPALLDETVASFFSWNWPSKHSWIIRIKSEERWKLTGQWEEEVPHVSSISYK